MGITEQFAASPGWLQGFKSRHRIRQLNIQGEKLSGDTSAADLYVTEFKRLVAAHDLSPEQIYIVVRLAYIGRLCYQKRMFRKQKNRRVTNA
jgi:hypothetical protein